MYTAAEFICTPVVLCHAVHSTAARLSTSVAKPQVQVVTHLCYSDFQDIMQAVDDMDGEAEHSARGQRV
jgi:methionine synthase II (cobalamin-independent)